jgi:hypothetical protein
MSRDLSGNYTLPAGVNPVVAGTVITADWGNTTLADVAAALTDSLSRSGKGGMTAPLRFADGAVGAPAITFATETTTGFYRPSAGELRVSILGVQVLAINGSGVTSVQPVYGPAPAFGANNGQLVPCSYVDTYYAPLASPALTGVPTAPTAAINTNTNQIATMAALYNQVQALPAGALPSLAGNADKYLTNDGSTVNWGEVDTSGSDYFAAESFGGF